MKVAADVPLDVACVIGCAVQTGVGAVLNTARVEAGATVLVLGLGGIGLSIVQGARIAGAARIVASDPVASAARGRARVRRDATCSTRRRDDVGAVARDSRAASASTTPSSPPAARR